MGSPHFTPTDAPIQGSKGQSKTIRDEFSLIEIALQTMNEIPFVVTFDDFNVAKSRFVAIPWAGKILRAYAVNDIANTAFVTILTLEIAGVLVTTPTWQWGATDARGTVINTTPTALNAFAAGDDLEIITNGGGTSVMPGNVTLVIQRT